MAKERFSVHNMFGPTVWADNNFRIALLNAERASSPTAGPYTVYERREGQEDRLLVAFNLNKYTNGGQKITFYISMKEFLELLED